MSLDFLTQPVAWRLTLALLHFAWQGFFIAAVLATVVRLLRPRRVQTRYMLSLSALFMMAACPVLTFALAGAPPSSSTASAAIGTTSAPPTAAGPAAEQATPSVYAGQSPVADSATGDTKSGVNQTQSQRPATAWALAFRVSIRGMQPWLLAGWIAGLLLLGARLLTSVASASWLRRDRTALPERLAVRLSRVQRRLGLGLRPCVFSSERVGEAIVVGLVRPLVLLPVAWLAEMTPEVLEAVVAHELAHVRRWDMWANLLQRLVETLLFYHPAVWWLSRRISLEREMCCDELAVVVTGSRVTYANTLELVARRRLFGPRPVTAIGIGGRKMTLLARVRNVLGVLPAHEDARWWPVGLLAILMPVFVSLTSIGAAQPEPGVAQAPAQAQETETPKVIPVRGGGDELAETETSGNQPREKDASQEETTQNAEASSAPIIRQIHSNRSPLKLQVDTTRILTMKMKFRRIQVKNPRLVRVTILSPNQLQLKALKPGVTEVTVWDAQGQSQTFEMTLWEAEESDNVAGDRKKDPIVIPARQKEALRYDGKTFSEWRDRLLTELKPERRIEALTAMGAFGARGFREEATAAIMNVVHEYDQFSFDGSDKKVLDRARVAMRKMGPQTLPSLIAALKHLSTNVRYFSVRTLEDLKSDAKPAVPALLKAMEDSDPRIRQRAILAIYEIDPQADGYAPALMRAIKSKEPQVCRTAIGPLAKITPRPDGLAVALVELLSHEHGGVREHAVSALSQLGPDAKPAIPMLIRALEAEDRDTRHLAIIGLGDIGPSAKQGVPELIGVLEKADTQSRWLAARALGNFGQAAKAAIPAILEASNSPDDNLSKAATAVLKKIAR